MVLVQFCLGGIDLYGEIDACFSPDEKQSIIRWIYDQQVVPNGEGTNILHCGFKGGPFMTIRKTDDTVYEYSNCANLAATYSALACLAILGDDFSRVNRDAIIGALKHLQMPNGRQVSARTSKAGIE
ncbi:Geranylgeranyl transferase type-1 subunit beta [Spiromyces aspiralis]|uniref:Geranylgeranyl transferase type-1 subunit beta n=1 Tax=Spiromyces aspiralis TaxID=68401 RepID=A0ACC1HBG3_9FUNG|nr:Geranylgeranyl transferase type-1 subunit beta [Spiromyces aspiralis]